MRFFFLDTNLFLQCRPLTDLDWDRFSGSEEVTLLIPSAVLTELDKHKADGNNRRAQRARGALKFLDALLESEDETVVIRDKPARVIARFAPEVPNHGSRSNDDSIVFEIAEMARTKGNGACALITHDTNLKIKARRQGLTFFAVPDEWLLPPEPDERDKRVKQLEEQVARLSRLCPVIEISGGNGAAIELTVPDYAPLEPAVVTRLIECMRVRYPMKTDFSLTRSEELTAYSGFGRKRPPPDWEVRKYQKEHTEWEERIRARLEKLHSALRIREATIDLCLLVANAGSAPVEHIEVEIAVSEGLVLARPKAFSKLIEALLLPPPRPPSPPEPRTDLEDLSRQTRLSGIDAFVQPHMNSTGLRRDRDEFYLKEGKDIDTRWLWEAENMRHGKQPEPFDGKLGLQAQTRPSGGQISVCVSAGNLPEAQRRQFPVGIRYISADTETAAAAWLGVS
jgi:rRNA-processing protein FCF1